MYAVAGTLISGAFEAWAFDHIKNDTEFRKSNSLAHSFSQFWGIPFAFIGGIIAENFGLRSVWLVGGIFNTVSFLLAFFLMKPDSKYKSEKAEKMEKKGQFIKTTKEGFKTIFHSKVLKSLALTQMLTTFSLMALNMFWNVFLNKKFGIRISLVGLFFSFASIFISLGSFFSGSKKLNLKFDEIKIYSWARILTAISIFFAAISPSVFPYILFFMLHEFFRGFNAPIISSIQNKFIKSEIRATTISVISMLQNIGGALGLLFSGLVAENFGIETAWVISSLVMIFAVSVFVMGNWKTKSEAIAES